VVGYFYLWSDNGGTFSGTTPFNAALGPDPTAANVSLFNTFNQGASPTVSKAPFGQITYPITDRLRVTGGVRYTQDSKSQAVQIVSVYVPGFDSGRSVINVDYSATTYKAGIEFDVKPASMLYAQLSSGYKAGGFATTANPPKTYGPEHVKAYEVGIKNRFLDDKLQLNAGIYYYDYTDLQVQYHVSPDPALPIPATYIPAIAQTCGPGGTDNCYGNFQQYIANAGAGKNKGVELETRYRFTADDELGDFADPSLVALNGEQIAATPKSTLMLNYEHYWTLAGGRLGFQVNSKWSSSYDSSVSNRGSRPFAFQKAYTRSDASLTYDTGRWTIGAWVKNIENKAQLQFGDFPLNRNVVNFPRTLGASLSAKF
jgi:iron complex outermembrane recepter protein